MSSNPKYRKTKRYTNQLATKIFTIDDARNIVIKIKKLDGMTKNTIDNYEKLFNDFDRFFGEKTDIASLTTDDVRDFIHWQLHDKMQFKNHKHRNKAGKKGVSIGTCNTYIALAKGAFNVLVDEEVVEENIFLQQGNIKQKQQKVDTLSIEEIKRIFRTLNKALYSEFRCYVILNTLLDSFGRISAVLSLKKEDLDFNSQTLTFTDTKNGRVHIVPVTNKTLKLLKELIEENEDFSDSPYIFLTNHGKPLNSDAFRKHLREVVKRAGIKRRIHPHQFRHTASMLFLQQNGSMRVLQKLLDHAEYSTTAIYAHVLDSTIKEQHEKFSPLNLIEEKERRKTKRKVN